MLADVPFTLRGAAERLAEVIDREAGGRAVVVGLSLGGFVAMDLAARSPERVRGLVIAGATVEPIGLGRRPRPLPALGLAIFDRRLTAVNAWFFRARFGPAIAEPIIAGGFFGRGGAAALRALVGERFVPRLAAYPGPTLILNGPLDLPVRISERTFLRAARDGRLVRIARRDAPLRTSIARPPSATPSVASPARWARPTVTSAGRDQAG